MNFISHFIVPIIQVPPTGGFPFTKKAKAGKITRLQSLKIIRSNQDDILLLNNRHVLKPAINNQVKNINLGTSRILKIDSNKLDGTFQKEIYKKLELIIDTEKFKKSTLSSNNNLHLYIISHGIMHFNLRYMMDYVIIISKDILSFGGRDHEWSNDPEKEANSKLYDVVLPREFTLEQLKDLITIRDIIE